MSPRVGWHSKRAGFAGPFAFQRDRRSRPLLFKKKDPQKRRNALKGVSHEGDGEVGRMFYRRPDIPPSHPFG